MRYYHVLLNATFLVYLVSHSDAARILGMFHFNGKSHFIMFENLLKNLAAKGHDVVVLSHIPQEKKFPNYTDLSLKGTLPDIVDNFTIEFSREFGHINLTTFLWDTNVEMCETALQHPLTQNLLKSNETFDLIITELLGADCFLGFAHKFDVPVISMTSSVALPWGHDRLGNPDNPSYIPNYFLPYTQHMSLYQRVINLVYGEILKLGQYYRAELPTDNLQKKYFGENIPPLSELKKRTSLVFVNSHYSINQPRPTVPAFIEVGGLHIAPVQKLPKDLQIFLDEAKEGVVYFSLGSLVKGEDHPEEVIRAFLEAFKSLSHRVLWKCDGSAIKGLPPNVKASPWLPQNDILNHRNVKIFISHCGLMGIQEAVQAGIPIMGIPFFADQRQNIEGLVYKGAAVKLEYDDITKDTFLAGIKKVLEDPSYHQNMKRLSIMFRDRPQSSMETAIFWTEYVIRYHGAPHLRTAAADIPLYQYLLLDVFIVLLLGLIVVLAGLWYLTSSLISRIKRSLEWGGKLKIN